MLNHLKSKKFLAAIILIVFLIILVPLVIIFIVHPVKQKQTAKNAAQKTQVVKFTSTTELATFNGSPIYVSDLTALALEQYGTNNAKNLNPTNIDNLLNIYVERKILDKQNLGDISVQAAQIEKTSGINAVQAKYEALKDKFTATSPKSWNAYSIGFWLPPTNADGSLTKDAAPADPSQTNADRLKLLADVNSALNFSQAQMQKGTSVFNIASQITKNYPTLSALLGINGLIFANSTDASLWNNPAVYYYNKTNANDPFYKILYAMTNTSPATKVLNNDNMGGSVIEIVKVNNPNGILDNYQDWLKNQESSLKFTNDTILKLENAR
jgi:hypothetical protein